MKSNFFEGKDFKNKFKALMPEFYPSRYKQYINEETELLKKKLSGANRVLEAGIGIGRLIPELAPIVKEFIGIDIADRMLKEAMEIAKKFPNTKIEKLEIVEIGNHDPENYFDYSLCVWNTLGNVMDEPQSLRALAKVTSNSIIITVYKKGTLDDRKKWYKTVGIPIKEIDEVNEIFYSKSGLRSKSYSVEDLQEIARKSGLKLIETKTLAGVILWGEFKKS